MRLITDDAIAILTVWQESRDQSFIGKCAVGEVIRERVRRHYNSDGTIPGTCCRPYQFSGWNTEDPNRTPSFKLDDSDQVVHECRIAWEKSATTHFTRGAVLYCNLRVVKPTWAKPDKIVAVIGDHTFFRDP